MTRKPIISLALMLVSLLAACSASPELPAATPLPPATVAAAVATPTTEPPAPAATVPEAAQPVPEATSRGDSLVASDPASVQLAAGSPVLVEFFRFT